MESASKPGYPGEDQPTLRLPERTARRRSNSMLGTLALAIVGVGMIAIAVLSQGGDDPNAGAVSPPATPTVAEVEPTATATPTAIAPTEVPAAPTPPAPTPTRVPPTPIPWPAPVATVPAGTFDPGPLPQGDIVLPIGGGVLVRVPRSLEAHHGPGHTAIYFDEARATEVDIFRPYAQPDGTPLGGFVDVVSYVQRSPQFASLLRSEGTTLAAGHRAASFLGTANELELGFHTDPTTIGRDDAGWFVPSKLRIWIVDAPTGVVIISAEALASASDDDHFEAVLFASNLVDEMEFR